MLESCIEFSLGIINDSGYHCSVDTNPIPKHIHFIWLGSSLPNCNFLLIEGWKVQHPEWKVSLWDELSLKSISIDIEMYKKLNINYGAISDICRYRILSCLGGVYIDVDYKCLKPLDNLISYCSFFACESNTGLLEVNNGILGCCQGHPLMNAILEKAEEGIIQLSNNARGIAEILPYLSEEETPNVLKSYKYAEISNTLNLTGPLMLTSLLENCLTIATMSSQKILIVSRTFFHSLPNNINVHLDTDAEGLASLIDQYSSELSIAVHLWQKSWQR